MINVYVSEDEPWDALVDEAEGLWELHAVTTAIHNHVPGQDCGLVLSAWPTWLMCREAMVIGSPTGASPYEWTGPLA